MATSGGQQRLDWYAVPGVPLTLILDTADGSDWPSAPRVLVGPREADGDITPVLAPLTATITATPSRATLTLTDAQMATILTAYPVGGRSACPWHVRLGTGESETAVSTGYLIWDVTGHLVTTSATLVVGARGVSVSGVSLVGGDLVFAFTDGESDTVDVPALDAAASAASAAAGSADAAALSANAAADSAAAALASEGAAGVSETAAAGSASAAASSASTATTAASTATTQAGSASTSASAAAGSASAASASASNAAGSASAASIYASNAAASASAASGSASTATTQAGIATTQAGNAATSASNAATSETNAAASAVTAAATVLGTDLGTADLDTITTPGIYYQDSAADATAPRNYPLANSPGVMHVYRAHASGTYLVQRYTPAAITNGARITYQRRYNSTWSSWYALPTVAFDATAGRAASTWDVTNSRAQLTYGDTGWRDISSLLANGWTGTVLARRMGYMVEIRVSSLSAAAATSTTILTLPTGFTVAASLNARQLIATDAGTVRQLNVGTDITINTLNAADTTLRGSLVASTLVAWPTSLPGSSYGSIPNT